MPIYGALHSRRAGHARLATARHAWAARAIPAPGPRGAHHFSDPAHLGHPGAARLPPGTRATPAVIPAAGTKPTARPRARDAAFAPPFPDRAACITLHVLHPKR